MQLVSGLATSYLGSSEDAELKSQGQNLFSRVFPRGPSFCLLPWSYFPMNIWLDTFQVGQGWLSGLWVHTAWGIRDHFPLTLLDSMLPWGSWKKVLHAKVSGEAARV